MSQLYSGIINLSKIPKDLIKQNRKGESIIYVDFAERQTPSPYGDTHYLKLYDVANRTPYYIGDFRPRDFGNSQPQETAHPVAAAPGSTPAPSLLDLQPGDLPF